MRFEPIGMCWWQNLCDWWNPPLEERLNPNGKNYCIKCWTFKYKELGTKKNMIEITKKRYEELLQAEKELQALEDAGVDSWDGYEIATSQK